MVVSSLLHANRQPERAEQYRSLIAGRPIVISFVTVTELRYGGLKAGWGEFRRRALERDLVQFVIVQPDNELMQSCAELRATCEQIGHALGQKVHEGTAWPSRTILAIEWLSPRWEPKPTTRFDGEGAVDGRVVERWFGVWAEFSCQPPHPGKSG